MIGFDFNTQPGQGGPAIIQRAARTPNPLDLPEIINMPARQLDLMEILEAPTPAPEAPGALDYTGKVAELITKAFRGSPFSREQIADKMTVLTGQHISIEMLNAWTAESRKRHRFPLEFLPAFQQATDDKRLIEFLVKQTGGEVYCGEEALNARLGLLEIEKHSISKAIKNIKNRAS